MSMSVDKIVLEALDLSPQARAFVAERLIESLDVAPGTEMSQTWRLEIQKRCREVDEGLVTLRDEADVIEKAYGFLG